MTTIHDNRHLFLIRPHAGANVYHSKTTNFTVRYGGIKTGRSGLKITQLLIVSGTITTGWSYNCEREDYRQLLLNGSLVFPTHASAASSAILSLWMKTEFDLRVILGTSAEFWWLTRNCRGL
jgi:hypothetical protein